MCWPEVSVFAHVDHPNFASETMDQLLGTMVFLRQCEQDCRLSLSVAKIPVWASSSANAKVLSAQAGFDSTNVLGCIGCTMASNTWC